MHNHLRHLVVNFLVSKLFTRVGPRAAFVIRNVESMKYLPAATYKFIMNEKFNQNAYYF